MRPPLHMLANAPLPDLFVPPPDTRGIRDTARPVPHDSAEYLWPDRRFTAYAWRAFFAMLVCTNWTTSVRDGGLEDRGQRHDTDNLVL